MALIRKLYQLPAEPTPQQLTDISEPRRPFRTWTTVLIRATADRLTVAA
jgi:DNA-3-methyladenine glycosylase II